MTEQTNTPTIKLIFTWNSFSPDHRQYKPSNPIISCNLAIQIEVPLTPDLIVNSNQIMSAQLTNQKEDQPILTPLGMRYCIDQFETVMSSAKMADEKPEVTEDTSTWDDSDETTGEFKSDKPVKKSGKAAKEETWDDSVDETKPNKDEKWDETWET